MHDIFDPTAWHNDKKILAYHDREDKPFYVTFSFGDLKAGSPARAARCNEFDRLVEALKGQGCDAHVWGLEYWSMYKKSFIEGKQLRR